MARRQSALKVENTIYSAERVVGQTDGSLIPVVRTREAADRRKTRGVLEERVRRLSMKW